MNWKELDEEDEQVHHLKDIMILLGDIPEDKDESEMDEDLSKLKREIDLHTGLFKDLVGKTIFGQRKLNTILSESEDILNIMKRLRNVEGYTKILEGVDEYTSSLDVDALTEEYRKNTKKVNEYRRLFKGLREIEKFKCSVCLEAMCDTFLDPCGHTVCQECATRVDKKCPYCRGTIFKAKRMIFS